MSAQAPWLFREPLFPKGEAHFLLGEIADYGEIAFGAMRKIARRSSGNHSAG